MRAVAQGRTFLSPELGALLAAGEVADPAAPGELTPRETDVLRLIALGHTNPEIARLLGISVRTVESHRGHISSKLGCSSRADLVRHALSRRLLDD